MSTPLPDSGKRASFETGAVRDASDGKGWPSEIPPIATEKMGKRFEDGAAKYSRGNWREGIPLSRYQDSITRHLLAWSKGQTDEDHLGAVLWNAACAAWTEEAIAKGELPKTLDDLPYRPRKTDSKEFVPGASVDLTPAPTPPKPTPQWFHSLQHLGTSCLGLSEAGLLEHLKRSELHTNGNTLLSFNLNLTVREGVVVCWELKHSTSSCEQGEVNILRKRGDDISVPFYVGHFSLPSLNCMRAKFHLNAAFLPDTP